MKRTVLCFGLALTALFSAAAASASTAAAAEFHTAKAPATLSGVQEENVVMETEGGTVTCKKDTTTAQMTTLSQTTVTTNFLGYSECSTKTIFGSVGSTVDFSTNHCNFTFHAGPPGSVDLKCDAGSKGVIISGPGCEITVPSQSGRSSISYINNTGGTVTMSFALTNVTSSSTGSFCSKTGTSTNGRISGKTKITGNNGAISVS